MMSELSLIITTTGSTGLVELSHGCFLDDAFCIEKKGLSEEKLREVQGAWAFHMTPDEKTALQYGQMRPENQGGGPAIVKWKLPYSTIQGFFQSGLISVDVYDKAIAFLPETFATINEIRQDCVVISLLASATNSANLDQ